MDLLFEGAYGLKTLTTSKNARSAEVFVKSALYTLVALRNSETTSWSRVEDMRFHEKARKVAY